MPPFPKPTFAYPYDVAAQVRALRRYRREEPGRAVPAKRPDRLLVATWNVANLGVQQRRASDFALIAEIVSWFDLVALQEVNEDLSGLRGVLGALPRRYQPLYSDSGGNRERMTFVYDTNRVEVLEEVGEVAFAPADYRRVTLPGVARRFDGFDRNPYLATFRAGALTLSLVNVHLFFGSDSTRSKNRRALETYAVARYADLRRKSPHSPTRDIVALGDFNLPKAQPGDPIYEALTARGLHLPQHSTQIGSNLDSDSHYDQVAFFPGETAAEFTGRSGVFDFDGAVFAGLWANRGRADFEAYVRYYLSDHRPLWAEFRTDGA